MATASPNILVVEDDRETRSLIAKYLRGNGCNVAAATDGREMARAMADHRVDLLILDVMLPGEDGLSLCRKVRAELQVPIIMLTARGEDVDRILGLEMGADDYLAKPFNPRELLARINAVLRRQAAAQTVSATNGATALAFLGWRIDFRLRELRNPAGARVAMTSAEFDLLRTFCERPGRVLSRESLLDLTQGRNSGSFERSIDVLVSRIRRKIETDPQEATMIKTVRSGGYMFTPTVETLRRQQPVMRPLGFLNLWGISGQIAALVIASIVALHLIITVTFLIHRPDQIDPPVDRRHSRLQRLSNCSAQRRPRSGRDCSTISSGHFRNSTSRTWIPALGPHPMTRSIPNCAGCIANSEPATTCFRARVTTTPTRSASFCLTARCCRPTCCRKSGRCSSGAARG